TKEYVLANCQGGDQVELLVNHAYSGTQGVNRLSDFYLASSYLDIAAIWQVYTRQYLHYGGLACTVFPYKRMYFLSFYIQTYLLDRLIPWKIFAKSRNLDK